MYCFKNLLNSEATIKIHYGIFCSNLVENLIQYVSIKESVIELNFYNPDHHISDIIKLSETPIFSKINDSAIIKSEIENDLKHDILVLALNNNRIILLEFNDDKNCFIKLNDFDLTFLNTKKSQMETLGKKIKVFKNYIVVTAYKNYAAIFKYTKESNCLMLEKLEKRLENIFDIEYNNKSNEFFFLTNYLNSNNKIKTIINVINIYRDDNPKAYLIHDEMNIDLAYYRFKIIDNNDNIICFNKEQIIIYNMKSSKFSLLQNLSNQILVDIFALKDMHLIIFDNNQGMIISKNLNIIHDSNLFFKSIENMISCEMFPLLKYQQIILFINSISSLNIYEIDLNENEGLIKLKTLVIKPIANNFIDTINMTRNNRDTIDNLRLFTISDRKIDYDYLKNSVHEIKNAYQLDFKYPYFVKFNDQIMNSWVFSLAMENLGNATEYNYLIFLQMKNNFMVFQIVNLINKGLYIKSPNISNILKDELKTFVYESILDISHFANNEFLIITKKTLIHLNIDKGLAKQILAFDNNAILSSHIIIESTLYILITHSAGVKYYKLSFKNKIIEILEISSFLIKVGGYSFVYLVNFDSKIYLLASDYHGNFLIYDPMNGTILKEYNLGKVINSAVIIDYMIYLGTREGFLIILKKSSELNLEFSYQIIQEKHIASGPLDMLLCNNKILLHSLTNGKISVFDIKKSKYYSLVIMQNIKENNIIKLQLIDKLKKMLIFQANYMHICELNESPTIVQKTLSFNTKNCKNFINYAKKKDKLRRIIYNEIANTISLISLNMDLITCDLDGNIIHGCNLLSIMDKDSKSIESFGKIASIEAFYYENAKHKTDLIAIGTNLDVNKSNGVFSCLIYQIFFEKNDNINIVYINKIDGFSNHIHCIKYIHKEDLLLIGSGNTLYLYRLNQHFLDNLIKIEAIIQKKIIFMEDLISIEYCENNIIITERNNQTKIYAIIKINLGENLDYRFDLILKHCQWENRMVNHATFIDKDSYIELDKFGGIYISSFNTDNTFGNLNISSRINLRDTGRKLINFCNKNINGSNLIFHPTLQGGLNVIAKIKIPLELNESEYYIHEFLTKFERWIISHLSFLINGDKSSYIQYRSFSNQMEYSNFIDWRILDYYNHCDTNIQNVIFYNFLKENKQFELLSLELVINFIKRILEQIE